MNEQKQDLLAFLRELQFVIYRHKATITFLEYNADVCVAGNASEWATLESSSDGECPSLAEAIERLESELTPQRETPDEDGTSYL